MSPALSLAITLAGWLAGAALARRLKTPLVNPVVVGVLVVLGYLALSRLTYATYARHAEPLTFLLGPAVVALALPLHEQTELLRRNPAKVARAIAVACALGLAGGWVAARLLHLSADLSAALLARSATAPLAMATAHALGRSPAALGALAILTGMTGATIGPGLLTRIGIRQPIARGLALGCVSHGIGTARILEEGDEAGAAGALGMCLNGVATALAVTLTWRWLAP